MPADAPRIRVGQGFDVHPFSDDPQRPLVLGGVAFPGVRGLAGHSDADVIAHAVTDALLGAAGLGDIGRHFPPSDPQWKDADSLQLLDLAPTAKIWVDLGSGGGFPGVVIACALAETPGARVHLVERNAKKAAFLREAVRITSAPATVHLAGIGDSVDRIGDHVDCVTARALAPLHQLVGFAEPFVKEGAKALFVKGQDVEAELTEATKYWNIEPRLHSSRTGGHGWIVELDRIERRNPSAITHGDPA